MDRDAAAMILLFALMGSATAYASDCPGNPDALGTERVLEVDAATSPRVGRKQFPVTLPLAKKELVLTFDDGPWPGTTPVVLDALKRECVHATFFLIGQHAEQFPALARRALAEGHTLGHHTHSHRLLDRTSPARADDEIDRGIAEDENALYGKRRSEPTTPFFRFPGFVSTPALLNKLERRGIVVFGADVWASDWNRMSPSYELSLIMARVQQVERGIVLFHDTKAQTAAMLPAFLRELKRNGFKIVHVVPAQAAKHAENAAFSPQPAANGAVSPSGGWLMRH